MAKRPELRRTLFWSGHGIERFWCSINKRSDIHNEDEHGYDKDMAQRGVGVQ